jgi:hypothetical protein
MSSKKSSKAKPQTTPRTGPQAIKIGSRVRCTDDGVEGRIVWANAVSVKVCWDDGEQVTWRRDSMADRPIEILPEQDTEDQASSPAAPDATAPTDQSEPPQVESEAAVMPTDPAPEQAAAEQAVELASTEPPPDEKPAEVPPAVSTDVPEGGAEGHMPPENRHDEGTSPSKTVQAEPDLTEYPEERPAESSGRAKTPRTRRQKPANGAEGKESKLSALDAAFKVLAEAGQPMNCKEMIGAMAAKGYWTSPGGKTPHATLYSAILREIQTKGDTSRFRKADRGRFACANVA